MKKLSFALFLFAILISCSKKSKNDQPIAVEKTQISLDSSSASPGDLLQVKLNKRVTTNEIMIMLGTNSVKGFANGDSAYSFILPVLSPGSIALSIPAVANSSSVNLTIRNYSTISNPQLQIDEFLDKTNKCIDSLTKSVQGVNFTSTSQSDAVFNELKEELNLRISRLSTADKELFSYIARKYMPKPSELIFNPYPPVYYAKGNGTLNEMPDQVLINAATEYLSNVIGSIAGITVMIAGVALVVLDPEPVGKLLGLAMVIAFYIKVKQTWRKAEEVGRLKGVGENITEAFAQKIQAAEFFNNTEKSIFLFARYRNLKTEDVNIHPTITSVFNEETKFIQKYQELKTEFSKLLSKTEKLKTSIPEYSRIIGSIPTGYMTVDVNKDNIIVKGASDNRIIATSNVVGNEKRVKITSTATQEIPFDLKVAYRRSIDGTEFTKDIACIFKPEMDSTEFYKASMVGDWKIESYNNLGAAVDIIYTHYRTFDASGNVWQHRTEYYTNQPPDIFNPPLLAGKWSIIRLPTGYHLEALGRRTFYPLTYPIGSFWEGNPPTAGSGGIFYRR